MQDIIDEILRGESKTLEFKEQMPANQSIVKTVIAFANTSGGKLIIGVNDDREIVGITDDIFELQDKISSIIYESCYPALLPHMYTKNIEGKIDLGRGKKQKASKRFGNIRTKRKYRYQQNSSEGKRIGRPVGIIVYW